ncbi:GrpB family protein [Nocardia niigatensis]|uniref:GrpB family protein n=1 Tax=Nocardia niigatensis TaxID=209249 RepID=UPI0002E12D07|nr:GrpB family protein [Nocardia niigatensis]
MDDDEISAAFIGERVLACRDRLRGHPDERARYELTKHELAQRQWKYVQHCANARSTVIEETIARALTTGRRAPTSRFLPWPIHWPDAARRGDP